MSVDKISVVETNISSEKANNNQKLICCGGNFYINIESLKNHYTSLGKYIFVLKKEQKKINKAIVKLEKKTKNPSSI